MDGMKVFTQLASRPSDAIASLVRPIDWMPLCECENEIEILRKFE